MLGIKNFIALGVKCGDVASLALSSKPDCYGLHGGSAFFLAVPAPVFCHSVLALPSPPEALPVDGQGFSLAEECAAPG